MKEIVIATKNQGKLSEIAAALSSAPARFISLAEFAGIPDAVENGVTFAENALIKARFYAGITGKACLADDSGLEVDALGGGPGVFSARYAGANATDAENNEKLLAELAAIGHERSKARFRCVLALVDTDGRELVADGCCEGYILEAPYGAGGFGYDPLFYVEALGQSMGQLTMGEKNAISHRGVALRRLAEELAVFLK